MRGANLLVHVNAFAMLVDAIGQLARPPLLGLLHLAALFRAGVLHHAEYLLDVLFRRGRSNDENQIVITLFHGDLFPSLKTCCVRGFATSRGRSSKSFSISAPAVPAVPARRACGGLFFLFCPAQPSSRSIWFVQQHASCLL